MVSTTPTTATTARGKDESIIDLSLSSQEDDGQQKTQIHNKNDLPPHTADNNNNNQRAVATTPTNNTSTPSCETCGSTKDVEEDEDNPGDCYCKSCWEEYSQGEDTGIMMAQQQNQQEHPPRGDNNHGDERGEDQQGVEGSSRFPSTSTSELMTPRGLSLGTQEEGASTSLTATPASQALTEQGGHSSVASTQDQNKGEIGASEKRMATFKGGKEPAISMDIDVNKGNESGNTSLGPEYVHEMDDDESKDEMGGDYGLLTQASKDNESDTDDNDGDSSVSTAKGRGNHHDGAAETNDGYVGMAKNIIETVDKRKGNQAPMISVVATAADGGAQAKSMALSGLTEPSQSQHKLLRDRLVGHGGVRSKAGKSPNSATVSTPPENKPRCSNHSVDGSSAYKGLTEEEEEEEEEEKEKEDLIRDCAEEDVETEKPPIDEEVINESASKVNAKEDELDKNVTIEGDGGNKNIGNNDDDTAPAIAAAALVALKPPENETQDSAPQQPSNEAGPIENKGEEKKEEASDDGDCPAKTTVEVSSDLGGDKIEKADKEAKKELFDRESEEKAQPAGARPLLHTLPSSDCGIGDRMSLSSTSEKFVMAAVEAEKEAACSSNEQQYNGANNSASKEPGEPTTPLASEAENELQPSSTEQQYHATSNSVSEQPVAPLEAKDCNEEANEDEDPLAQNSLKERSECMDSDAENETTHSSTEQKQDCGKTALSENKALLEDKALNTTDKSSHNNKHANTNTPSCKTCGSSKDCEDDIDNPGDYFCKSCWEEYARTLEEYSSTLGKDHGEEQNQQEKPPGVNNTHGQERVKEQQGMTFLKLNNNDPPSQPTTTKDSSSRSPSIEDASITLLATPASQALLQTQQGGYSSLASTQDQKKGESEASEGKDGEVDANKGSGSRGDKRDEITRSSEVIHDAKSLVEADKDDELPQSNFMAKAVTNANEAMALGGEKRSWDIQKERESQGGTGENIESDEAEKGDASPGPEVDNKGDDDDDDASILGESEGQHVEGTGDTFVTNASGSAEWSLYGGDTQMLPTGPSQLLAASSTNLQMDLKEETKTNNNLSTRESLLEDGEKQVGDNEAPAGGSGGLAGDQANNGLRENPYIKDTQQIHKPVQQEEKTTEVVEAGGKNECVIEERDQVINDHHNFASMENMKHTPQNGSLPISYPNDHLDNHDSSSAKKASCKRPPLCDKMEEDDGDETTQSQDLLAASPAKPNQSDNLPQKPSHQAASKENILKDIPAQAEAGAKSLPLSEKCNSIEVRSQTNNIQCNLSRYAKIAESSQPKEKVGGTKWMSSARHAHGNQANGNKDDINSGCSSPRLLMPSFKPIRKNSDDGDYDDEPVGKPAALKKDAADDRSETDSWSAEQGHNFNESDSIDNTQDEHEVKQPASAFKRLSRGTSARSDRPHPQENIGDDSSSSKFSSPRSNVKITKTNGDRGSTRVIKPKVLRYEAVAEHASLSSRESESSSEAEFTDEDNTSNVGNHFQQSQSDARIIKQLQEVKAMTSKLPSAEEMNEIISRKQLSDEIAELKKSHKTALNKVERENSKLVTQLKSAEKTIKNKDELIKQKDQTIKQKKDLLNQQFAVIANLTAKVQGVANIKSSSSASSSASTSALSSASSTKKHTPGKRKKKNEKPLGSDSDSDVDDDEVPLSALKSVKVSSTNKKRRKSYGGRNKVQTKKDERDVSPKKSVASNCSNHASSIETPPVSNRSRAKKLLKTTSSFLSPELWKKLRQKGWTYQTGPEPHNKVYVPKDGATHPGTQLGIHFHDCDSVINAAIACGDLAVESSNKMTATHEESVQVSKRVNSPASSISSEPVHASQESDAPMDDSKLHGNLKLLTLETAQVAVDIVANFVRNDDRFIGCFFDPLWKRLQDQGTQSEAGLNWRYTRLYGNLSTRSWGFAPPSSTLGAKGVLGKDYFVSEAQVALRVLEEVRTIEEVSHLLENCAESFSSLLPVLQLAVKEDIDYKDAKLGKSSSVRSRRTKRPEEAPKGKSPNKKQPSPAKKRASKITPEAKGSGSTKKQKTEQQSDASPSFHMSQTQAVEVLPTYSRRNNGPLSGYSFFYSGVDPNFLIEDKIQRLGGKMVAYNSLTVQKASKQAFFLADYTSWRKMKYICAAALGTPMLHYQWLVELEQKFKENGDARIFDHECYVKYRLPIGLDLSKGFYSMQSPSNARCWDAPGYRKGEGTTIFHGMTIALAIDQEHEADWKMIIKACGAKVKTLSDVQKGKGKIKVDCCLFSMTSLPPHVIARPAYVSKMLQFMVDETPLLDLAWAHQSVIQRKCLPLDGDGRYSIYLGNKMSNTCNIFSIKTKISKRRSISIRYEVGDLVQFSLGPKTTSHGRIVSIALGRQEKECKLEIQLLESNGGYDLVDCPSSAKIFVEESSLQGNISLLCTKNFQGIGYLPNSEKSNIFNRVIVNKSQMDA